MCGKFLKYQIVGGSGRARSIGRGHVLFHQPSAAYLTRSLMYFIHRTSNLTTFACATTITSASDHFHLRGSLSRAMHVATLADDCVVACSVGWWRPANVAPHKINKVITITGPNLRRQCWSRSALPARSVGVPIASTPQCMTTRTDNSSDTTKQPTFVRWDIPSRCALALSALWDGYQSYRTHHQKCGIFSFIYSTSHTDSPWDYHT